ncbi:MAG: hypothetical protein HYZ91_07050 [Candidatus Omnitrophica bacterium]|nr:hypothetical protein [Candidatus Omnitrophota bacterium]
MWRRTRKGAGHPVRRRGNGGQSILEYLVIATVIVAAIIIAKGIVQGNMNQLYQNAAQKTSDAATALSSLAVER